jgi:hypothetical protein
MPFHWGQNPEPRSLTVLPVHKPHRLGLASGWHPLETGCLTTLPPMMKFSTS